MSQQKRLEQIIGTLRAQVAAMRRMNLKLRGENKQLRRALRYARKALQMCVRLLEDQKAATAKAIEKGRRN